MEDLSRTQSFSAMTDQPADAGEILHQVYEALEEKGYNPVNQIVGYIMSGDPTYITGYKGARQLITRVERYELLEELVRAYVS